jgi:hypothetical protein
MINPAMSMQIPYTPSAAADRGGAFSSQAGYAGAGTPGAVPFNDLSSEMLANMGTHSALNARIVAAQHPSTPANILLTLSKDADLEVRARVAGNRNSSEAALQNLYAEGSAEIDRVLAANPNLPSEIAMALYQRNRSYEDYGMNFMIPTRLAKNPAASIELLKQLSRHIDSTVRQIAIQKLSERAP